MGTMHPDPQGYAATDKSSTRVIVDAGLLYGEGHSS